MSKISSVVSKKIPKQLDGFSNPAEYIESYHNLLNMDKVQLHCNQTLFGDMDSELASSDLTKAKSETT